VLHRETGQRTPLRSQEVRLCVGSDRQLVEAREQKSLIFVRASEARSIGKSKCLLLKTCELVLYVGPTM
jgi:hypothetical protein